MNKSQNKTDDSKMSQIPSLRPSPDALLNPCADPTFKTLFTEESKEARRALTCFLSDIIGKKVSNVVLQPNELSGESVTDKQSEFDINCKIEGKIVNIEMQGLNKDDHFGKRVEYHVAHLYNHYVCKGMDWKEAQQAYQISVLNFIFDGEEKECISHYMMKNQNGRTIAKMMNVIFMELPKILLLPDDISLLTAKQMWGKFFLYASASDRQDFVQKLAKHNRGIEMAVTVLKNISRDEINWYRETRYWMHISDEKSMISSAEDRGVKKGIEQGIQQGIQQNAIQTAKNLLEMNLVTPEQIAQATGISLEKVLELQKAQ